MILFQPTICADTCVLKFPSILFQRSKSASHAWIASSICPGSSVRRKKRPTLRRLRSLTWISSQRYRMDQVAVGSLILLLFLNLYLKVHFTCLISDSFAEKSNLSSIQYASSFVQICYSCEIIELLVYSRTVMISPILVAYLKCLSQCVCTCTITHYQYLWVIVLP